MAMRRRAEGRGWLALGVALAALGCTPGPEAPRTPEQEPVRSVVLGEPAPEFLVQTVEGDWLDSRVFPGPYPLLVVVFATWCKVCELTLSVVRSTLAEQPRTRALGVLVDDDATPAELAEYRRRRGLHFPVVDARRFPGFALAWDPLGEIPAVTVVAPGGRVVEHQVGWRRDLHRRLTAAITGGSPGGTASPEGSPRTDTLRAPP